MKTPLKNTDNNLQRLFREATQEQPSYTESHTKRDLLRAADASLLTRIRTSLTNIPGKYLMTFSTALVAIGLSTILLQNPELTVPTAVSTPSQAVPKALVLGPAVNSTMKQTSCCTQRKVYMAVADKNGTIIKSDSTTVNVIASNPNEVVPHIEIDTILSSHISKVVGTPILCDQIRTDTLIGYTINGSGSYLVSSNGNKPAIKLKSNPLTAIDVKKRNAVDADDFLTALGIRKSSNAITFVELSNSPDCHITQTLYASGDKINFKTSRTKDAIVDPDHSAKELFSPMFIVQSNGSILEFNDKASGNTIVNASDPLKLMELYKDSCVTVVVHPDDKTPVYLLYYPSAEFLNALPREKALQVRAEQGNAEALRELQNSYKGCRYMSFCSTSNGAIEDTEILGSLSSDTRVRITLKEQRTVRVALYDIVGRMVAEIDKGSVYNPGQHIIPLQFRADNQQAPTFYLLCITTDAGEKVSQRVVLGN